MRERKTKRTTIMRNLQTKVTTSAQEFIRNAIYKELDPLYKETKSMAIANSADNKKLNEKDATALVKNHYIVYRIFSVVTLYYLIPSTKGFAPKERG